ncbi:PriCT-2 domain-containing protein [Burkholderia cepacia]|uniref:PriCT-2 domain-containing protein n=1 Tax=Burkholderia cepacia TaxID=292 RepID=UPI00232B1981|nr:PriCT-2 domain-containing protein [Burkholderia cepacia]
MLATVKPDCDYHTWRNVVWAIASTGWNCAKDVARKWSMGAPRKFDESHFLKVWHSFDAGRGIGFGTLVHYAAQNGYLRARGNVDWMGADIENGRRFADNGSGVRSTAAIRLRRRLCTLSPALLYRRQMRLWLAKQPSRCNST